MKTRNKICAAAGVAVALSYSPALANEFEFGIILQGAQYESDGYEDEDLSLDGGDGTGQALGVVARYTIPTANGGFIGFQGTLAAENTSFPGIKLTVPVEGVETTASFDLEAKFSADLLFLAGVNASENLSFYGGIGLSAAEAEFPASVSATAQNVSASVEIPGNLTDSNIHLGPKVVAGLNYQLADGYKLFAQLEHAQYDDEDYFDGLPLEFNQTKLGIGVLFSF
ncbi:MAG: outer membrane beta-barrel protein [Rhodobacteraceae bacterium]|nr:outer membrane beta-barrel protein [Paracoccaceae bacterium]